jgi:hypothetical protein
VGVPHLYSAVTLSTDDAKPRRVRRCFGDGRARTIRRAVKSARDAIWIDTPQGRFVLRRKDGPAFDDGRARSLRRQAQ